MVSYHMFVGKQKRHKQCSYTTIPQQDEESKKGRREEPDSDMKQHGEKEGVRGKNRQGLETTKVGNFPFFGLFIRVRF